MPKYTHQLHGWFYPRRIATPSYPAVPPQLTTPTTAITSTDSATLTDSGAIAVLLPGLVQMLPVAVSYTPGPVSTTVSSAS